MKTKDTVILAFLLIFLAAIGAKTQSRYTIFYQDHDSIYGIPDLSGEPYLIASGVPETVAFSNSGHYAAFKDSEGVWISRTETWSPERVISILPRESFALWWTPDDSRLILSVAFWPEDTEPEEQPLAYNLLTEAEEPWVWGRCDQIAQHVLSRDFALICEAYEALPTQQIEIDVVALEWGGEFSEYDPDQYEVLLDGILDFFPRPFDWGTLERNQNMVYIAENPDYQRENEGFSFWRIISLWNDGNDIEVDGPRDPEIELWFAVSDDRSLVAYTVFCGDPSDSCLQIMDLNKGGIIWSYEDTIRIARPFDIDWFPDNQRVALLGANSDGQHIIQVFDIDTGNSWILNVGNTTGIIAVK